MSELVEDVGQAWRDALATAAARERLDRWWRNGGLSYDPMRRMQADYVYRLETDLACRPFIVTSVA